MIAAILKGKISSQVEGSEDLLTSVVFGVLEQLPVEVGIARLLALAAKSGDVPHAILNARTFRIEYWPWWREEGQVHGAEPDVALWLTTEDDTRHLVIVEAKRDSGKSGHGDRDQLARQIANGRELARRSSATLAGLIYVTAHVRTPTSDLDDSRRSMANHFGIVDPPPLWWVSWRQLVPVLEAAAKGNPPSPQAGLVVECLVKWGLVEFNGVSHVPPWPRYTFALETP